MDGNGTGPIQSSTVRRTGKSGSSGGTFSAQAAGEEPTATATQSSAPLAPIDSLLALQEVPDATVGRRRAVRRANDLLDRLNEIRDGFLTGSIPRDRLERLGDQLRMQRERVKDPNLASLIDEIELRCAVELAKLDQLPDNFS